MISSIEWIPKGVADPNPKRYELSKAERELLEQDQDATYDEHIAQVEDSSDTEIEHSSENPAAGVTKTTSGEKTASQIIAEQPIDPSTLPAELRMDDYSDDEDDDGAEGADIGSLLIDNSMNVALGINEDGELEDHAKVHMDSDESDDDGDELDDIPDTRDYSPTDIKGLEAMNFGGNDGTGDLEGDEAVDDEDSEADDTNLRPEDALIIVAKTEDDFAALEVIVYEETSGNLFVHHDIPLPAFPLCLAHGTINRDGGAGNYVAVGTFDPGIEIWNADVLNVLEPSVVLGGEDTSAADAQWSQSMGKKGKARPSMNSRGGLRQGSHTDAVMSLSWNTVHRQVIASGSADKTVKLWDITKADDGNGGLAATLTHHSDKVQSMAWHPSEGTILATGSYDRTVAIIDARNPGDFKRAKIPADCESIAWDPHQSHLLSASCEDGTVLCWDVRMFGTGKPYWSFVAHEFGGCSDISYNPNIPGMLATCAVDKTVALWDTHNPTNATDFRPMTCGSKDMNVGKLYTVAFYQSSPWLLGCAGSGNKLSLWNLHSEQAFRNRFGERVSKDKQQHHDELVGDVNDNDKSEEDNNREEDFEAMMAAGDQATDEVKKKAKEGSNKKAKGKSNKKKTHKKR